MYTFGFLKTDIGEMKNKQATKNKNKNETRDKAQTELKHSLARFFVFLFLGMFLEVDGLLETDLCQHCCFLERFAQCRVGVT